MNRYSEQKREKALDTTVKELQKFIGVLIYMSIMHFPTTRHYWNSSTGFTPISHVITCNRFEELKRFLRFTNNEHALPIDDPSYDKLQRIRPLIDKIRDRLLTLPREEYLAIDEQVIPTKARTSLKNYNPKKPHKWGYKAFVLSGVSGLTYDFELYAGAQSNVVLEDQPDLGVSSNVAIRLSSSIPQNLNYKLFFDNWYTSLPLMAELYKKGILALGTVNRKRLPNNNLPTAAQMSKQGRGFSAEKMVEVDDVEISVVTWLDNKIVNLTSTYVGKTPEGEVQRFNRKKKTFQTVPCPKAVQVYNRYMGGVDLLDSMLGYYRIKVRSKKWYHKIFFHLVDLTCVNSWILWRKTHEVYMPLLDFKLILAESLTRANQEFYTPTRNRVKPEGDEVMKKRDDELSYLFLKLLGMVSIICRIIPINDNYAKCQVVRVNHFYVVKNVKFICVLIKIEIVLSCFTLRTKQFVFRFRNKNLQIIINSFIIMTSPISRLHILPYLGI